MEEVVVATVHLESAKNAQGVAKRAAQAARCHRAVREFREFSCARPEAAAVIVAGDCNAEPHEPAVATFVSSNKPTIDCVGIAATDDVNDVNANDESVNQRRSDEKEDVCSAPLKMFSAYERALGSEPAFTTWKIRSGAFKPGEAKMCIDYIFLSEGCEVVGVGLALFTLFCSQNTHCSQNTDDSQYGPCITNLTPESGNPKRGWGAWTTKPRLERRGCRARRIRPTTSCSAPLCDCRRRQKVAEEEEEEGEEREEEEEEEREEEEEEEEALRTSESLPCSLKKNLDGMILILLNRLAASVYREKPRLDAMKTHKHRLVTRF
jgi:hypothetical protein